MRQYGGMLALAWLWAGCGKDAAPTLSLDAPHLSGPVGYHLASCDIGGYVQSAPCATHGAGVTHVSLDSGRLQLEPSDSLIWREWHQTVIVNFSGPWSYYPGATNVHGSFQLTSAGVALYVDTLGATALQLLTMATAFPAPPQTGAWAGPDSIKYVGRRLGYGGTMSFTYVRDVP